MPPCSATERRPARVRSGSLQTEPAIRLLALILPILILILALPAAADRVRLGDRFYDVILPDDPQGAPMILALHGGGGNPGQFAAASGLGRDAAAQGYAVIFPAGSVRFGGEKLLTWNGGYCCGYAARAGVDDLEFLAAVIGDAQARFGLDGARVYLAGMSNGAILAETFAARNPGMVRAVAGVAGTMDTQRIRVQGPVPLLVIHGTADTNVPYAGGVGADSLSRTDFAAVASVVAAFLTPWGDGLTQTRRRLDAVPDDGTAVTIADFRTGGRTVVRLITVEGGAHHWPGGGKARLRAGKTAEIAANAEILRFFALHR